LPGIQDVVVMADELSKARLIVCKTRMPQLYACIGTDSRNNRWKVGGS
jgi:hypothetical protein